MFAQSECSNTYSEFQQKQFFSKNLSSGESIFQTYEA